MSLSNLKQFCKVYSVAQGMEIYMIRAENGPSAELNQFREITQSASIVSWTT